MSAYNDSISSSTHPQTEKESLPPFEKSSFIEIRNFHFFYGTHQALSDISLKIPHCQVTAFIGPSGCGKSTLLRSINRMNEHIAGTRRTGDILLAGKSIYDKTVELVSLRRRIGMVFQRWNPFPKSIYENVVYGLRIVGIRNKKVLNETVERSLRSAALWEEVKDRLHTPALSLSGGQQQRLCIARTIATQPEVILMDEPCSALDPSSTMKIEQLIHDLTENFTMVIVTHNMQQAMRISDRTAFFCQGQLIEDGFTDAIFTRPSKKETEDYITGRFG